jgi:hypothetical protein
MEKPNPKLDTSERLLACEEAMEPGFRALIAEARKAGWTQLEAWLALLSLADHTALAESLTHSTDHQIREGLSHYLKRRLGDVWEA